MSEAPRVGITSREDKWRKEPMDKPFPPDPDAGYVRPHAEIHSDLLKANIEINRLKALLLTPEEAGALVLLIEMNAGNLDFLLGIERDGLNRLRLLSDSERKP